MISGTSQWDGYIRYRYRIHLWIQIYYKCIDNIQIETGKHTSEFPNSFRQIKTNNWLSLSGWIFWTLHTPLCTWKHILLWPSLNSKVKMCRDIPSRQVMATKNDEHIVRVRKFQKSELTLPNKLPTTVMCHLRLRVAIPDVCKKHLI